jgi:hypothetical protein
MSNPLFVPREYRDFFGIESGVPATDTDWFMVPALKIVQRMQDGSWTKERALRALTDLSQGNEQLASEYVKLAMEGEPPADRGVSAREFSRLVREEPTPDVLEDAMRAAASVLHEAKQLRRFWAVEEEVRLTKWRLREQREIEVGLQTIQRQDSWGDVEFVESR